MRKVTSINDDWFFTKEEQKNFPFDRGGEWERIGLPHTWNALDGQDGGADYYKGDGYYYKCLFVSSVIENRKYYLEIEAASAECTVFLNGQAVGDHKGGYSAFRFDITKYLCCGNNELAIVVCNSIKDDVYPQMADFTFYGGLYRGVKLIEVEETHFQLDYYGTEGISVWSKIEESGDAVLYLDGYVVDPKSGDTVRYLLTDGEGRGITEIYRDAENASARMKIPTPHLWQGVEDPYLYTVTAQIVRKNQVMDEVSIRHGFRSFYVDPQRGFFLNGVKTPLRGVSRHQDRLGKGNALTLADHREDAALIRQMGANSVRLAHYQHSREFYSLCDEYGFIVWAEIPFISRMNPDPKAHENCILQLRELIIQNFNHSSICFWGIANEITIGGSSAELEKNLRELDALAKRLDHTRLTTIAQVSPLAMDSPLNGITDLLAYNHYFGWYGGELTDNERWFDGFHEKYTDRAIGISEYGCEGIISYHNDSPRAGDYSEEYQALYHEHMLKLLENRDWIWGSYVWNAFDFGCDARDEGGVKGRNNKGLVTFDRKIKKDSFYLYRAYWSKCPTVHICGKRYYARGGEISLKVYTNCPKVTLYHDGEEIGCKSGERVLVFEGIKLHGGINRFSAVGEGVEDMAFFERTEELPEYFTLKDDGESRGVTNWFDGREAVLSSADMTFRKGFFSVRDTVRDLLSSEESAKVITDALSSLSGMALKSSMLMMMADQTVEELLTGDLAAAKLKGKAEFAIAMVNAELQKLRKPE